MKSKCLVLKSYKVVIKSNEGKIMKWVIIIKIKNFYPVGVVIRIMPTKEKKTKVNKKEFG